MSYDSVSVADPEQANPENASTASRARGEGVTGSDGSGPLLGLRNARKLDGDDGDGRTTREHPETVEVSTLKAKLYGV